MAVRTLDSHNSPLQIGEIDVPSGGAVGFTLCPGKQQAHSMSGRWLRDLDTDLDAVARWGAAAVVTLMPMHELQAVQAHGIGEACERRGIEWHHLPIRDVDVPDASFEAAWCYAGVRLRAHLRGGAKVLVHCRGGLGRSGTIAARLLVELGWPARQAIAAVRAQRPGAIETRAQEQYVLDLPGAVDASTDAHSARVLGCVLGGAVGDAFGYAIEFDRLASIQRKHGPQGLQEPVLRAGQLQVSDDTQMTLFTLEALLAALPGQGEVLTSAFLSPLTAACQSAYLRWGDTQGLASHSGAPSHLQASAAMRQRRAPGNTCLSAIRAGAWGTPERSINDSKGCGAVMRTAPLGLLRGASPALAFKLGCAAGALTHGHVDGWLPAGVLAALVRLLAQGLSLETAAREALTLSDQAGGAGTGTDRLLRLALRLAQDGTPGERAHAELGEGWTGDEALAIAMHAGLSGRDFVQAVRIAANHDGDSDSTASIAGQLCGTRDGILAVPHAWVRRLDVLEDALQLLSEWLQPDGAVLATSARLQA